MAIERVFEVALEDHEVQVLGSKLQLVQAAQKQLQQAQGLLNEIMFVFCGPDVDLQSVRFDMEDQVLYVEEEVEEKKPKKKRKKAVK